MKAVLIGTDLLKDVDGSFKAIETNTNIHTEIDVNLYIDLTVIDDIISGTGINEIVLITKNALNGIIKSVDLSDSTKSSDQDKRSFKAEIKSYCEDKGYTFTLITVEENSITVPYVEDAENKLIIRASFDTTALIDDTYAKDNWEFLKLMHDADVNSIPKTFINDAEFGLDSIGTVIRNNGNHPNYLIKKRYTPADYRTFPKILKINTIDELESIKELLEIDEYLQEYIYNPGDLLDNRIKHYRSVDLLYGSNLDVSNLWCIEFGNAFEIEETCDYDNDNLAQYWERPKYINKFINPNTKDPHLSGDKNTLVLMNDNSRVKISSLENNSVIKTVSIPNLPIDELDYIISDWSSPYEEFIENYNTTTAALKSKRLQENWIGFFCEFETIDGIKFSDVSQAAILCKVLESGSTDNYIVKFKTYAELSPNDTLLLYDTETSLLVEKTVNTISYSYGMEDVYTTDFEQIDIFLTMEESENTRWGILTHNYTFDCEYLYPYPYCYACGSGSQTSHGISGCCRSGGFYGGVFSATCYLDGLQNVCYSSGYCNSNKSDKRLKKKIKQTGITKSGVKLYAFEFKKWFIDKTKFETGDDISGTYEGVLAQDLIGTRDEIYVRMESDGYYSVDYEGLEIQFKKI
jgi:hypothetical protein